MRQADFIYFIPGIMGTSLVRRAQPSPEIVWSLDFADLTLNLAYDCRRLMDRSNVVAHEVIRHRCHPLLPTKISVYGDLLDFLESKFPKAKVIPFAYDWRASNSVNAQALVRQIKANHKLHRRVFLVAHSMGGLIALLAARILRYGTSDQSLYQRISKIINIGTPHFGSAKAFKSLKKKRVYIHPAFEGWCQALISLRPKNSKAFTRLGATLRGFESLYELLPPMRTQMVERDGQATHALDEILWSRAEMVKIDFARKTHELLEQAPTDRLFTIYSHQTYTEEQYGLDVQEQIEKCINWCGGDGTVCFQSAQGAIREDRRSPQPFPIDHMVLPNSQQVLDELHELLR